MNLNDTQHLSPAPRTDAAWLEPHWMPYTGNREIGRASCRERV